MHQALDRLLVTLRPSTIGANDRGLKLTKSTGVLGVLCYMLCDVPASSLSANGLLLEDIELFAWGVKFHIDLVLGWCHVHHEYSMHQTTNLQNASQG